MTGPHQVPFDPGLQPERTSLAWERTALSLFIGAMVYSRVEERYLGPWSWGFAVVGTVVAVTVGVRARARYRYTHRSLTAGRVLLPDGVLPLLVALVVFTGAVLAAVFAIAGAATS